MEPLFVVETGGSVMSMWFYGGMLAESGGVADGTGQQISKC